MYKYNVHVHVTCHRIRWRLGCEPVASKHNDVHMSKDESAGLGLIAADRIHPRLHLLLLAAAVVGSTRSLLITTPS